MKDEQIIKKYADQLGGMLEREIEKNANYHCGAAGLDRKKTEMMKRLVFHVVKGMEMSIAINAEANDLPIAAVYITLIESIAGWSKKIDELAVDSEKIARN